MSSPYSGLKFSKTRSRFDSTFVTTENREKRSSPLDHVAKERVRLTRYESLLMPTLPPSPSLSSPGPARTPSRSRVTRDCQ